MTSNRPRVDNPRDCNTCHNLRTSIAFAEGDIGKLARRAHDVRRRAKVLEQIKAQKEELSRLREHLDNHVATEHTPVDDDPDAGDWIAEASTRALEFLAALAVEGPEAEAAVPRAWDTLMLELDDPRKLHTMLYSLVWTAHCMRTSAAGDTDPGTWTFELHTPLGQVPVDQAQPAVRWVSRWLIACMNGDVIAAADLWFGTPATEEEALECTNVLAGPLLTFLRHSVREFLRAGRPLVLQDQQ